MTGQDVVDLTVLSIALSVVIVGLDTLESGTGPQVVAVVVALAVNVALLAAVIDDWNEDPESG